MTSTQTEPLRTRLHQDPSRGDQPRDVKRVVMRVDVDADNGTVIEGHHCPRGVSYIEVYEDRVSAVEARVRTPADLEKLAAAKAMAAAKTKAWIEERMRGHRGTAADREAYRQRLEASCPEHWAVEYNVLSKGGLPCVVSAEVVQAGLPAPVTPENAATRANEQLADVIRQAIVAAQGTKARDK